MNFRATMPRGLVPMIGLAVLLNYVDRAALAIAAPMVQDEFALSAAEIGLLLSAFFWTYAPAQLLAGWLVHRLDVRVVMAAGLALWALATTVTGLAAGFVSILVLRLVLGLGESVTFPTWQLLLARGTTERERGRANGFIGAGQGVGPMVGTLFGGLAMAQFGWRAMFIGLGLATLFWLWPWFRLTRGHAFAVCEEHAAAAVSYAAILRCREFWGAAVGHFSINYAFYFVMTWLPSFIVKAGGYTVAQMAPIAATIFGIYAAATALAGVGSDRWIARGASATLVRKVFALIGALGTAITIAATALVEPRFAVWWLAAAGAFLGLTTPTMFAMTGTLAGPSAAGRWAGAQNLAGQAAGVLSPVVTGIIVDRTGAFTLAFALSAVAAMVAIVA